MSATALNRTILILTFVGIFIAGVLSLSHIAGFRVPCGVGGGCDTVQAHPSSKWGGIPVAYIGLFSYVVLASLALARGLHGFAKTRALGSLGLLISGVGAIISLYLTYYSMTEIKATCLWCMASAATMTTLAILHATMAQGQAGEDERGGMFDLKLLGGLFAFALLGISAMGLTMKNAQIVVVDADYQKHPYEFFAPKDAPFVGDADAKVTVVEFADLLCPSCRDHFQDVLAIPKKSGGKIKLVFRHYPLYKVPRHQMSLPGAMMAEYAAERGLFWQFVTAMYEADGAEIDEMSKLDEIAVKVGIDPVKAHARMVPDDPVFNRVYRDLDTANRLGLMKTPTFFILAEGEKPVVAGYEDMVAILQSRKYQELIYGRR